MRHRLKMLAVLAVVMTMSVGSAWAGFVQVGVELANDVSPGGPPPWAGPPEFVFSLIPDGSGNGLAKLTELFGGPETLGHVFSGVTDKDPILNIVKEINNDSGIAWAGFELILPDGGSNAFVGTATSTELTLISQDDYRIVFGGPGTVEVGETMTLDFDVLVPSTGPFSFTLTQTPVEVPEPAILALLLMGGVALVSRRPLR